MQTDVRLQEAFSYPMIQFIILLSFLAIFIFLSCVKFKMKEKKPSEQKKQTQVRNPSEIQLTYFNKLEQLKIQIGKQQLETREAFLKISELVRDFAYEMTGLQVQYMSLAEIEKVGIPPLTQLIQECYMPEFYQESRGDAMNMILKAQEVIKKWNINIHS